MKISGKTIIAIVIAVIGLIIGGTVLYIINFRNNNEATEPSTEPSTIASEITTTTTNESTTEITEPTQDTTTEEIALKNLILGEWIPVSGFKTETNEVVNLTDLYGKGYRDYGGLLEFNEDGTFSINIGITNNGDQNNGYYTCTQTDINVTYNNDKSSVIDHEFNGDEIIRLYVLQGEYTIVFERS